ncbi:rhomboid family protein [Abyssalbus ytuae]|uniref:Rhomboid family intramembrane serine protease n=1 Tax=Abyssalbus ytuae TaxID=2926907 RepID=A0A9E7CTV5_9FLAO|nr:rhomboid family intramembrane serine protease [Abyssalbus ytuae]UOB16902.1 rhomboid family intramembrane serine protease [Abyssalbus ytuae]
MGIRNDIRYNYARLSVLGKLIVINIIVFILSLLIPFLFNLNSGAIVNWFQLPKDLTDFITQPWSIVTYSFFHASITHIFWNMVLLFFAGRIFLNLFSSGRFINVYFLGVIIGGLTFLLSYNLFPVFSGINTALIGASAGVMAVLIFVCSYIPDQDVRIIFFNIKLWYIGAFFVLLDLVQMTYDGNAGGHLAHLGGAFIGFLYARKLYEGKDIGTGFEKVVDGVGNIFKRNKKSPLKTVHKQKSSYKKSNAPSEKSVKQKQIDDILDKISKSGYESLSKEEKDFLFKAGKE